MLNGWLKLSLLLFVTELTSAYWPGTTKGELCNSDDVSWIQLQVDLDSSGARHGRTEVSNEIQLRKSVASNSSSRTDTQMEPPALPTAVHNMGFTPSLSMILGLHRIFIAPNEVEDHGITEAIYAFIKAMATDPFFLTLGLYLLGIAMAFVLVLSVVLTWKNSADEDMPKDGESLWGGMETEGLVLSLVGSFFEWYDFGLYGYMVAPIGTAFFPFDDQLTRILVAFATFGGAFLFRPVGGAVLGYLGDRYGRVPALQFGLAGMVLCTSIIGLMPNVAQIGTTAPILVVISRSLQGFFVGGQSTGSVVYVIESAKPSRRCFMSGILGLATNGGLAFGSGVAAFTIHFSRVDWCWRVPFASAILFGIVGGWASLNAEEAHPYTFAMKSGEQTTVREALSRYWDSALLMMGLAAFYGSINYVLFTWMPTYQVVLKIFPLQCGFVLNTVALALYATSTLVWGWLADHGRFDMLMGVGALILTILCPFIVPLFDSPNAEVVTASYFVLGIAAGPTGGLIPRWLVSQVPDATVRYFFIAVSYNLSMAVFGGFAPTLATLFRAMPWGMFSLGLYLSATALIGAYSVFHKSAHKHV